MSRILCKFILGVPIFLRPVFIEVLGNPIDNSVTTSFISEDTAHRPGAAAHLSDATFQNVGSAYSFPETLREIIKFQAIV